MASADPFWKDAVEGIAKNVHDSAKRFRDSVGSGSSLAAFTSKGVEQLQAAVDELVEIVNAKVKVLELSPPPADGDPVQAADEHVGVRPVHVPVGVPDPVLGAEHGNVPEVVVEIGAVDGVQAAQEPADFSPDVLVRDVVKAAKDVVDGVTTGNSNSVIDAAQVVAKHTKSILYVVQVAAAQAAAKGVVQVAAKGVVQVAEKCKDLELVEELRVATKKVLGATKKVLGVSQDVSAPTTPLTSVSLAAVMGEVIKAAKGFESLKLTSTIDNATQVKGKQHLLDAVKGLRVATNRAQLYAHVEIAKPLSQEILNAAIEFRKSVDDHGLVAAYTDGGVRKLRSAMDTLLVGVGLSVAAPELTHDTVSISRAPGEVEVAAQSFRDAVIRTPSPSVESNEAFRHLLQVLRGATNRVLFGVEVLGATQELVGAAREFKELAIEDPRVVDSESQGVAMEKIRDAANLVPDPVPRSICAVNEVALAAKRFQDWASDDKKMSRSTVHMEVIKFQKKLQKASKCVDDDRNEYAYAEAVNLSLIRLSCVSREGVTEPQYPLHKAALEDWEQKEKELFSKVSRRQGMRADLTNQIFNIIGWYAVFLGVVLSAVSQLTQTPEETTPSGRIYYPLCSKIWFPVFMTGFGLLATILGIGYKFSILMSLDLTITTEKQAQREIERRINTLRRKGPDSFSFTTDVKNNLPDDKPKGFGWGFYFLVGALIALAVLFSLSYGVILCNLWVKPKKI